MSRDLRASAVRLRQELTLRPLQETDLQVGVLLVIAADVIRLPGQGRAIVS
jgi:hypothetical protein